MYELVAEISDYPKFLGWCREARIVERRNSEVTASISVARGPANFTFTTQNEMTPPARIEMNLLDGPFSSLSGEWRFDGLGESGCKVSLQLEFRFKNRVLAKLVEPIFRDIASREVDAFCERAEWIYGR